MLSSIARGKPPSPSSLPRPFHFMGKAHLRATLAQAFGRVASERLKRERLALPSSKSSPQPQRQQLATCEGSQEGLRATEAATRRGERRLPLSEVVSGCAKRWFQDALREAKAGDFAMQVLVGQMYRSGYGTPRNGQKGKAWISRAARYRTSVWKVSNKHPGYNASDSDSEELSDVAK